MKILISEKFLNEIINADLSYIKGDQPYAQVEIAVSKIKDYGKQNTSDDYVEQATQDRFFPAGFSGWGWVREEEKNETAIGGLDVLDILNQKGLKLSVKTLVQSFATIPNDRRAEIVSTVLKYLLESVDLTELTPEQKNELSNMIKV